MTIIQLYEKDQGAYYTITGNGAVLIALKWFHTLSVLKFSGPKNEPLLNVGGKFLSSLLSSLLEVEVYRQEEGKSVLVAAGSPGNTKGIAHLLGKSDTSLPILGALTCKRIEGGTMVAYGIACWDDEENVIAVSSLDAVSEHSEYLEERMSQLNVRECVVEQGAANMQSVVKALEAANISVTEVSRAEFGLINLDHVTSRAVDSAVEKPPATKDVEAAADPIKVVHYQPLTFQELASLPLCRAAVAALGGHLKKQGQLEAIKGARLVRYEPSPFLRLDARALAALQLVPTASNGSAPSRAPGSPATSLLSYLNRCKTSLGSRLLRRWLCRPLVDEEAISRRHAIVEFFYKQTLTRQKLRETHLRVFPDVARLVQKLRENNCTLKDLVDCYRGLTIVTFIAKLLRPGAPPPPSKPSQTTSVMPIMGLQDLRWRQHAVWELGEGAEEAKGHNDEGQGSSTEDSPSKPHFIDWRPLACSHDSATALSNIVEGLHDISEDGAKFLALIEETIDQETMVRLLCSCATANTVSPFVQQKSRNVQIRSSYHPTLHQLKTDITTCRANASQEGESVAAAIGLPSERVTLEHTQPFSYHFRVPSRYQKALDKLNGGKSKNTKKKSIFDPPANKQQAGALILGVQKDGVHFTTPNLKSIAKQWEGAVQQYQEAQKQIEAEIMTVAATYVPVLHRAAVLVGVLDVLSTFAEVAATAPKAWTRPVLVSGLVAEEGENKEGGEPLLLLQAKQARHPLVEVESTSFVANDIFLCSHSKRFGIITGPNMAGKSTYIRSAAILVVLNQIGCFVPAERLVTSVFSSVRTRVGSADQQLEGVSSFMGEMQQTARLLNCDPSERALMIIDELGRGTSTVDGFAIASATAKHLAALPSRLCLFATHFHELSQVFQEAPSLSSSFSDKPNPVISLHVSAAVHDDTITMTYTVRPGICSKSFGIHVAKLVGLPDSVVADATRVGDFLENSSKRQRIK